MKLKSYVTILWLGTHRSYLIKKCSEFSQETKHDFLKLPFLKSFPLKSRECFLVCIKLLPLLDHFVYLHCIVNLVYHVPCSVFTDLGSLSLSYSLLLPQQSYHCPLKINSWTFFDQFILTSFQGYIPPFLFFLLFFLPFSYIFFLHLLFHQFLFPFLLSRFDLFIIIWFHLTLNITYWQIMPKDLNLVKCVPRKLKMSLGMFM